MENLHFSAVIFDLDGVITDTAAVHSSSWKRMFDEYLFKLAQRTNTPFKEFTHEGDYLPFVDGKPRYKGVESFLKSRGITLPHGDPTDLPDLETVCGLGNRKNQIFNQAIDNGEAKVFESSVKFINELQRNGIHIGVASSSKNCRLVLDSLNLLDLFETIIDGVVSADIGLKGKPEPDIFTTACDNLGVGYKQAVIIEDAVSGVQAGRNGGFGLVLGVAREGNIQELLINGADMVVTDLEEMDIERIETWFLSQNHL